VVLLLASCADSGDPAQGGFVSGVAGLAGGGYEARIDEREGAVATSQARQAELAAELASLEAEHRALQDRITRQTELLQAAGATIPPETQTQIAAAMRAAPDPRDPAARAAALRQAIADARRLSEQLTALAS
jgi:outer membrane murein-binding lipoprotein Lpp